jgi:hypothetical protein
MPQKTSPYIIIIIPATFCAFFDVNNNKHVLMFEDTESMEDAFISITQLIYHLSHCERLGDGRKENSCKVANHLTTWRRHKWKFSVLTCSDYLMELLAAAASLMGVCWVEGEKAMMTQRHEDTTTQSLTLRRS